MPVDTNDSASKGITLSALSSPSSVRKGIPSRPGPGCTDAVCRPPGNDVTVTRSPVTSRTVAERAPGLAAGRVAVPGSAFPVVAAAASLRRPPSVLPISPPSGGSISSAKYLSYSWGSQPVRKNPLMKLTCRRPHVSQLRHVPTATRAACAAVPHENPVSGHWGCSVSRRRCNPSGVLSPTNSASCRPSFRTTGSSSPRTWSRIRRRSSTRENLPSTRRKRGRISPADGLEGAGERRAFSVLRAGWLPRARAARTRTLAA